MAEDTFPRKAEEINAVGEALITHLRETLGVWHGRRRWSKHIFNALRSFGDEYRQQFNTTRKLKHYPPTGTRKGAFLWDYLACQGNHGILIAAEIEHDYRVGALKHDFEKLLYVRSPIKIFIFWTTKLDSVDETLISIEKYMKSITTEYAPGEMFILFRVHWQKGESEAWTLQVPGDSAHRDIEVKFIKALPPSATR